LATSSVQIDRVFSRILTFGNARTMKSCNEITGPSERAELDSPRFCSGTNADADGRLGEGEVVLSGVPWVSAVRERAEGRWCYLCWWSVKMGDLKKGP